MTNLEHYLFGKHSKIPECCVLFFIHQWLKRKHPNGPKRDPDQTVEYIRCDNCLTENRKTIIHNCSGECVPFLKSIGREWFASILS